MKVVSLPIIHDDELVLVVDGRIVGKIGDIEHIVASPQADGDPRLPAVTSAPFFG